MRHLQPWAEAPDVPGHDAEAGSVALLGVVEEELQAEADAEERLAVGDPVADGVGHAVGVEGGDGLRRRALSGEDDGGCRVEFAGGRHEVRGVSEALECLLDAPEVARAVVYDRNGAHGEILAGAGQRTR